jgi:hypothetical protein
MPKIVLNLIAVAALLVMGALLSNSSIAFPHNPGFPCGHKAC